MKRISMVSLTVLGLVVAGCGDNGTAPNGNGDAGGDMGEDMAVNMDMTMQQSVDMTMFDLQYVQVVDANGLACGAQTCSPGQFCCVTGAAGGNPMATCAASCPDGGLPVQCNGPGNCGGDPCCLTLNGFTPESISCTNSASACPPMFTIPPTAGSMNQTRVCHFDGDCTAGLSGSNNMYDTCCHASANPNQHFCFSKTFASLSNGQVTCP